MWRLAKHLHSSTFILSHIESNYNQQRAWWKITEKIAEYGEPDTLLPEKIQLWYCMGGNMHSSGKMSVAAIYVPTTGTFKGLEKLG